MNSQKIVGLYTIQTNNIAPYKNYYTVHLNVLSILHANNLVYWCYYAATCVDLFMQVAA